MRTFVAMAALSLSTPSFAFSYPGAHCLQLSGGTLEIDSNGHVENESTTGYLNLICPLIISDATDSGITGYTYVQATDYTTTGEVCCDARAKSVTSAGYVTGGSDCTGVAFQSSGTTPLDLLVPANAAVNASRYVFCSLPLESTTAGSGVSEIRTVRFDE